MTYQSFSTDKADYFLAYVNHISVTDEDIFHKPKLNSLDAIVLESGANDYDKYLLYNEQYKTIVNNLFQAEKNIKVYLTDVDSSETAIASRYIKIGAHGLISLSLLFSATRDSRKKESRRNFLKNGLKAVLGLGVVSGYGGMLYNIFNKGEAIPVVPEVGAAMGYVLPNPHMELRNAVTARKVEEFIAPNLYKELGRKPTIALVYGGAHVGIKTDLKYKTLRDGVIEMHKAVNYPGIAKKNLNAIYEMDLKKNRYIRWNVKLF